MNTAIIVLCIIAAFLLVVALAFVFWWLRTQSGMWIRSFYAAVRKMEHEQGVESRYESPWLLLVGDPLEGEQLCRDWKLRPVGKQAWFGRWWTDQDASLLVVPQSVFLPRDSANTPTFLWRRLLRMLLRLRGQRPLDAVIWTIHLSQLQDNTQGSEDAVAIRRRFNEFIKLLGLRLPVYVLVTGLEEMPGFQELIAVLPVEAREQLLGWSSPYGLDTNWQGCWLDDALEAVVQNVHAAIVESTALGDSLAEELYRLPSNFLSIQSNLRGLLEAVFHTNTHGEAPILRGVYFGAVQAGEEQSEGIYSIHKDVKGVFTQSLWKQRVLAEQGLAHALPRVLRLRQRWQKIVVGITAVLGVIWLVSMLLVWHERDKEAQELIRLLQITGDSPENRFCNIRSPTLESHKVYSQCRLQMFWRVLQQAPRWHFSSIVFPTSWGTSHQTSMNYLLRDIARRDALFPLHQLQDRQLQQLLGIRNEQHLGELDRLQPDQWGSYVKSRSLVSGVLVLEKNNHLLNATLLGRESFSENLANLGNESLGLNLDSASLAKKIFYDQVLKDLSAPSLRPVNLDEYSQQFSEQLDGLMKSWLAQYFLDGRYDAPAKYLRNHLGDLGRGLSLKLSELEDINIRIGELDSLIVLTNFAWGHGVGEDLVPGYQELISDVRRSQLLGAGVEAGITHEASKLRRAFDRKWIERAADLDSLFQKQADGSLVLHANLGDLSKSIDELLQRDFSVSVMRYSNKDNVTSILESVTKEKLDQVLGYWESYQGFVNQELTKISPDYRAGMLRTAEQIVAQAMWQALVSTSGQYRVGLDNGEFSISADQAMQVIQAFNTLGQNGRAKVLQSKLTARAMAGVDGALTDIDNLPLFKERYPIESWDGKQGLGVKLFRSIDVQDLKQSLAKQFVQMGASAEKSMSGLVWLKSKPGLPLNMQEKVVRLSSIVDEINKYKEQNPMSSPALFEQLVTRDLLEIDTMSCTQVLQTAILPQGSGDLARHTRELADQVSKRCNQLQVQGAAQAWHELAGYFNQYLAGRFPFSYTVDSPDADPARVQYLLKLIDAHAEIATRGLGLIPLEDRLAADDFLLRMKDARDWLGVMLDRDKSEAIGVELDVRWRTDREDEQGADQVIAWTLVGNGQSISHPGEEGQRLRWRVGTPLQLVLRWARDSTQRPSSDPLQASMAVNDLEVGWDYRGPWALLRMMRTHSVPPRLPEMNYTDFPLTLQVPVRGGLMGESQAQMFMRVSLLSQGGKLPLSIQTLPVVAPSSPYSSLKLKTQEYLGFMP